MASIDVSDNNSNIPSTSNISKPASNINIERESTSSISQSETNNNNSNNRSVQSTISLAPPLPPILGNSISTTPSLTITPASPTIDQPDTVSSNQDKEVMKEKGNHPTDSETALISQQQQPPQASTSTAMASNNETVTGNGETSKGTTGANSSSNNSSPLNNLTRKLSGQSNTTTPTNSQVAPTTPEPSKEKANPTISSSTNSKPTTNSSTSSTKPAVASSSTQNAANKKKKKKKTGLAGFFIALGCFNADDYEDDSKKVKSSPVQSAQQQTTQKPNTSVTTAPQSSTVPSTSTTTAPTTQINDKKGDVTPVDKGIDLSKQPEPTATTGSTLVDTIAEGDKAVKPNEEVVLAPTEPHTLPDEETAGVTSSAVQAPGGGSSLLGTPSRSHPQPQRRDSDLAAPPSTSADQDRTTSSGGYTDISNSDVQDESSGAAAEEVVDEYGLEEEYEDEEDRLIEQGGMGIPLDENGQPAPLLPPIYKEHHGRKCLVLDLDETLLHSSFKSLPSADYIVPVEIESQIHNVYVIKRPGVDHFLKEMGKIYEIVVFTASLSKYADPVLDMLDIHRVVTHRLFRESCYNHKGNYVKDLSQLGRSIETSIIIDNSPASYIFHPNNAVPVSTWFNDPHDTELTDLCPFLTDLATVDDIRGVLDGRMN